MTTLETIMYAGIDKAREAGILDLPQKKEIPFGEDLVADFLTRQISDLMDFQTLEQFSNTQNMYTRASLYTYGKGVEYALSHLMENPLDRIGYDFDLCMQGKTTLELPSTLSYVVNKQSSAIIEMFEDMYQLTRSEMEQALKEGITFEDCIRKILNGVFFMGTRVGLSLTPTKEISLDFSNNTVDRPYDYDNYDQGYKIEDYRVVNVEIGDFEDIRHLFEEDPGDQI